MFFVRLIDEPCSCPAPPSFVRPANLSSSENLLAFWSRRPSASPYGPGQAPLLRVRLSGATAGCPEAASPLLLPLRSSSGSRSGRVGRPTPAAAPSETARRPPYPMSSATATVPDIGRENPCQIIGSSGIQAERPRVASSATRGHPSHNGRLFAKERCPRVVSSATRGRSA